MNRRDLYAECNVVGAPAEAFKEECCKHCINPECTRSAFGSTKFDQRVGSWYERLFENVPRMDPSDPRFGQIAAQKFVLFNEPLTVRSWVDPRDIAEPAPRVAAPAPPLPAPVQVQQPAQVQEAPPPPAPEVASEQPAPPQEAPAPAGRLPQHLVLSNTPLQQGQMLKPPAGVVQKPAAASWDAAPASTDTEGVTVVKTGARVKIG